MSKRKKAESRTPSELNENWGSNYMMDGFFHDMDYGHGNEDFQGKLHIPVPPQAGFAKLPDGVIIGEGTEFWAMEDVEQEGSAFDITDFDEVEDGLGDVVNDEALFELSRQASIIYPDNDRENTAIVDHSWLSDAFQDPARLPYDSNDASVGLQDAWGDRTDGIYRLDYKDRREMLESKRGPNDDDVLNADKLAKLVRSAMRRSAAGENINTIRESLCQQVGEKDLPKVKAAFQVIENEHGLAGNVFIRASAYPGLHQGKWSKSLQKHAKKARYLIACPGKDCSQCACSLGLKEVASVDDINWDDAYAEYAPKLKDNGQLREASKGKSKKEILRKAFLTVGAGPQMHIESTKVTSVNPADLVSKKKAFKTIREYVPTKHEIVSMTQKLQAKEAKEVSDKLAKWVADKLITQEDIDQLRTHTANHRELLTEATKKIAYRVHTNKYSGLGLSKAKGAKIALDEALRQVRAYQKDTSWKKDLEEKAQKQLKEAYVKSATYVQKMVSAGLISEEAAQNVLSSGLTPDEILKSASRLVNLGKSASYSGGHKAVVNRVSNEQVQLEIQAALLQRKDKQRELNDHLRAKKANEQALLEQNAPQVQDYDGFAYTAHISESTPVATKKASRTKKAVRWLKQTLSEGHAGPEVDQMLQLRFSSEVLKEAAPKLVQIRKKHEGLAGHIYVDASAYSKDGVKGCEEGALKHRANTLKYVLAMDKCSTCVYKNANNTCQKYGKELVTVVPHDNPKELQKEIIASKSMSEEEKLASLFTTNDVRRDLVSPVEEYSLHNANLDEIEYEEESGDMGSLTGIFFGGFDV